jgi:hypothetical protein
MKESFDREIKMRRNKKKPEKNYNLITLKKFLQLPMVSAKLRVENEEGKKIIKLFPTMLMLNASAHAKKK